MTATPIDDALFRPVHRGWTVLCHFAILAVGLVDYATAPEITLSLFYLIPVAAAAWLSGMAAAVSSSTLAALVWLCAELGSSRLHANSFIYAWNFCARLLFLMLVALLLARLHDLLVRERALSRTDPLTGLLNARAFREVASQEVTRARRYGHPLSLAFVDVDEFKRVNDKLGHACGDRVLMNIGEAMRRCLRGTDTAARYGGDEFAILLPIADEAAARAAIGKVLEKLAAAAAEGGAPVTVSVGVVSYPRDPPPIDVMLERADELMYEVKSRSKNGARFACDAPAPDERSAFARH